MGTRILLLIVAGWLSVVSVGAESFSCRDRLGRLHFADNPANLPADCRGMALKIEPGKGNELSIVPATPAPKGTGEEFDQLIRAEERERVERQKQNEQLRRRAEKLVEQYRQAQIDKRSSLRRWSYTSREEIKQADLRIAEIRVAKRELLQELETARMSRDRKQQIRETLEAIEDQ